jgi:hypothetical protein
MDLHHTDIDHPFRGGSVKLVLFFPFLENDDVSVSHRRTDRAQTRNRFLQYSRQRKNKDKNSSSSWTVTVGVKSRTTQIQLERTK